MSDVHAAIDIGTNSIHLVVARAIDGGGFDVVTSEKEVVRLGSGAGDMKILASDAIERGLAALARMVDVAESFGADVTAVATSAVREAENREAFVDRAARELGLKVEVISGSEEARLIYHGVIHALPLVDRRVLVVDIGGGSTEFIVGEGSELIEARSLRLGAIRLTQRFFDAFNGDQPSSKAVKRCRTFLRDALGAVVRDLGGHRPELAIGSSGTITSVASIIAAARTEDGSVPKQANAETFTADELGATVERLVSVGADERRKIDGLDLKRIDIIVGGALLLEEIFRAFELESMTVSGFALREGVLYDRFPAETGHLHDLRRSNALRLANQLDPDTDHAETAARLAVQLFDRTVDQHGLGGQARELLEVASLVHNVGMIIAHSGHHKHAAYVIRNSELLVGFSQHEIELIAQIARYHRKSQPSAKHPEFAALDEEDQRTVRVLAGILRIAIGLDRRHAGLVTAVGVRTESGGDGSHDDGSGADAEVLVIEPVVPSGDDVSVELFAANARSELLASALGVPVVIRERDPDSGPTSS